MHLDIYLDIYLDIGTSMELVPLQKHPYIKLAIIVLINKTNKNIQSI